MTTHHLRLVTEKDVMPPASSPPRGGSIAADRREFWLIEELTRKLVILDTVRGELFAALAHRDVETACKAARKMTSVAELLREPVDRYTRPVA